MPTSELPLGAVRPAGWYKDILRLQADNFTGVLDRHWDSVGSYSAWLGGTGENWERGPYYLDGLVPLAYLLGDEGLVAKARAWIEWSLGSQTDEGDFGPKNNPDWWPRMVMLKALMQYEEATGDERILPFMLRYAAFLSANLGSRPLQAWGKARGGELILWLFWLQARVGEDAREALLELAARVYGGSLDWEGFCRDLPFVLPSEVYLDWRSAFGHYAAGDIINTPQFLFTHVVNVAMGLKTPSVYSLLSGDPGERAALRRGAAALASRHGVVTRMFNGDEHLAGNSPSRGTELCAVVEYMFSLESVLGLYPDTWAADTLEFLAYNALPAAISGDFRGHQYLQQANQVLVSKAPRDWFNNNEESNLFGLEPNFGCCTANLHQGWPKFAKALWRAGPDGGLSAFAYAPSVLRAELGSGSTVGIETITDYPFGEVIRFRISLDSPERFPLRFRIPAWCSEARVSAPGAEAFGAEGGTWALVDRRWKDGDEVELHLPMELRASFWKNGSVGFEYGPLVLALGLEEEWRDLGGYPVFPDRGIETKSPWNYAVELGGGKEPLVEGIERSPLREGFSFARESSPLLVKVRARRVPSWGMSGNSAAIPPESPLGEDSLGATEEIISLVPYGFARLRVSQFPWYTPPFGTE